MPSLTLAEARARAAQLSDVSYDLEIDLTDEHDLRQPGRPCGSRPAGRSTFLELHRGQDVRVTVERRRRRAGVRRRADRARPGWPSRNEVVVEARLPYVTDGDGMHTFTDPADGERYVSAYVGIDITQRVFACFDQVDLKAPITLRVVADPAWTVLSNGPRGLDGAERADGPGVRADPADPDRPVRARAPGRGTRGRSSTPASRWAGTRAGRWPPSWTATSTSCGGSPSSASTTTPTLFDEPFPFDTYDQVFVPELNWGAMENPGCVTYRDEFLPRGRVTEDERRHRAMVIAHEMSHMWFGDLVTQTWWEDIWLNESFADYMGFRVSEDAAGFAGTWVGFQVTHKPRAHGRRPAPLDAPGRTAARGRARRGHRVRPTSTRSPT